MERPQHLTIAPVTADDLADLAALAARTFPLACPPGVRPAQIQRFIFDHLSTDSFARYFNDPDRHLVLARHDGLPVGYSMCVCTEPTDPDVLAVIHGRPAVEISKLYADATWHGRGVAARLMTKALEDAKAQGARVCWLGVNKKNGRAQRFYTKHGFRVVGTKQFDVGGHVHDDYIMARPL
ncbi:MAG: GNAT family N-acetyltransferase [Micrococcales bacterium]|nr:GNAT family N-acetyltransferase [Micrococcales bacterium]